MDQGLPPRALRLIDEWATLYQDDFRANWKRVRAGQPLIRIEPLA